MSSRLDEWGEPRADFTLADVFGCHAGPKVYGVKGAHSEDWEVQHWHSYLRFSAPCGSNRRAVPTDPRHPILAGFEETDIFPFGGRLQDIVVGSEAEIVARFIPPFPIYPPEFSWMRTPETAIPAIVARELSGGGRVVYLAGDIDRCYGQRALPDHGALLANAIRWTAHDRLPFQVEGPGTLDCHLYRQENRLIFHIVNISGANHAPGYVEENLEVGPVSVRISLPSDMQISSVVNLCAGDVLFESTGDEVVCSLASIKDHAVLVLQ